MATHLPDDISFALSLNLENAHELMRLCGLRVYFYNNNLVYIMTIPLIESKMFSVYHMSPLPSHLDKGKFFYIHPSTKYLVIRDNKQQYFTLTENELDKCYRLSSKDEYLCKQIKPLYLTHCREGCEARWFLSPQSIPADRDTRVIRITSSIWSKFETQNKWLYVLPKPEVLTLNCKSREELVDVSLHGKGTISIHRVCKGYTSSALVIPEKHARSENFQDYIPPLDQNLDCNFEHKTKINFTDLIFDPSFKAT